MRYYSGHGCDDVVGLRVSDTDGELVRARDISRDLGNDDDFILPVSLPLLVPYSEMGACF